MQATAPHVWTLKAGADRRFRAGHPWVYSNELAHSPRTTPQGAAVEAGDPVELRDADGRFLARGYGHPGTLIAFRALGRDPAEAEPWGAAGLLARLRRAAALRRALGLGAVSHRLIFGEADDLPGLVVERYRVRAADGAPAQALVLQQHTAGAERLHEALLAALQALVEAEHAADGAAPPWERTAVVLRNDVSARKLEGLGDDPAGARVLREAPGLDAARAEILVAAPPQSGLDGVPFRVDLVGGQKTGFYLDQAANVRLAAGLLAPMLRQGVLGEPGTPGAPSSPLRILDLFAYVGQWGAQLSRVALRAHGAAQRPVQVTALDASATALELAAANVAAAGAACEPVRADAMERLGDLPPRGYDVVVADPPAFIKGRKAYHAGRAAYVKLNAAALRLVRPGGLVVTCSCSQLLDEADFAAVLHKAAGRAEVPVRWLARGGQAPDHPVLAGFPEGHYLKCWVGVVG
jgi:23S rRNA (cytosine1962-C5)-methyltransferase